MPTRPACLFLSPLPLLLISLRLEKKNFLLFALCCSLTLSFPSSQTPVPPFYSFSPACRRWNSLRRRYPPFTSLATCRACASEQTFLRSRLCQAYLPHSIRSSVCATTALTTISIPPTPPHPVRSTTIVYSTTRDIDIFESEDQHRLLFPPHHQPSS